MKTRLENFQIDYLKLRIEVEKQQIKWQNLTEHPTIRNQYVLKPETWEFAKNFNIYIKEDVAILKFSLPYFLNGHNYCSTPFSDFLKAENLFLELTGINIRFSEVVELEYGAYEKIDDTSKTYLNSIVGIKDYTLDKSASYMKMFGNKKLNLHYKIYDAVANAKSKKTFKVGNYPNGNLIKHELKFTNTTPYFDSVFFIDLYDPSCSYWSELNKELINHKNGLVFKSLKKLPLIGTDLTGVLFTTLKEYERGNNTQTAIKTALDVLKNAELSLSQKSKRRKSLIELEERFNNQLTK